MNKALFEKVKAKCKDTGLSEKYLRTITEKMGGSIEDDSTDEVAMDEVVNQIAEIAVETQSEATRWTNKKKDPKDPKDPADPKDPKTPDPTDPKDPKDPNAERIAAMEKELAEFKAAQSKTARENLIKAAQEKHKIPDWRMKGLSVPDDQEPDEFLAGIKQDLITQKLVPAESEGVKTVTEKQVDEAADSLLESITAK